MKQNKIIALLLIVTSLIFFNGCGAEKESSQTSEQPPQSAVPVADSKDIVSEENITINFADIQFILNGQQIDIVNDSLSKITEKTNYQPLANSPDTLDSITNINFSDGQRIFDDIGVVPDGDKNSISDAKIATMNIYWVGSNAMLPDFTVNGFRVGEKRKISYTDILTAFGFSEESIESHIVDKNESYTCIEYGGYSTGGHVVVYDYGDRFTFQVLSFSDYPSSSLSLTYTDFGSNISGLTALNLIFYQ